MGMCGGPKWKREEVPDHKFDFLDTTEFHDDGWFMRLKYIWVYILILKSFLVYIFDIFSAITMLSTTKWANEIFRECEKTEGCFFIPFETGKWLFVGCIIFSFLLLAYEAHKSKKIIASRDISFAFTNVMANNYYSLRSYDHFCFFEHISDSTKLIDDFAFFVFFTFKSWSRLLLADGPRQTINGLTLYAVWLIRKDLKGPWYTKYFTGNSLSTTGLTLTALFTVLVFLGSLLLLVIAAICYIPLLCHMRGNLKEYCCHKVDKRIDDIIKRKTKERRVENARNAKKEAMGDYSHLKNKKGELVAKPLPQPTLPTISLDDDDDTSTLATRKGAGDYKYAESVHDYAPPMPAYNPYSTQQPNGSYQFNQSSPSLAYDDQYYNQPYEDEDTARLTSGAAPVAYAGQNSYNYPGRSASTAPSLHSAAHAPGYDNTSAYNAQQYGHDPNAQYYNRQYSDYNYRPGTAPPGHR